MEMCLLNAAIGKLVHLSLVCFGHLFLVAHLIGSHLF
jgi:hypothetical protein